MDTVFNNTKETTHWSAEILGKVLQRSYCLWLQQRKRRQKFILVIYWSLFVNEWSTEPIVIKKANQFVCFKFGDVQ